MIKLQSIKRVRRRFRLDPSLVLYLPLYELDGASFMSKDAYGHLCTVTGALWTPQGRWFDHLDDIIVTTCTFDSTAPYTLWVWINTSFTASADDMRGIIEKRNAGNDLNIRYVPSNRTIEFLAFLADGSTGSSLASTIPLGATGFTFVRAVWDGVTKYLFVNEVAAGTATPASAHTSASVIKLGTSTDDSDRFFDGYIGEAGISTRALSVGEGMNIYLATKGRYQ